ncbi:MAG: ABC transporter permease subunit [Planctomycetota bacterium]|nr:ABC transporter permease subunit [Planctomycetota bacterium]
MSAIGSRDSLLQLTRSGRSRSARLREFVNRAFFTSCLLITSIAIIALTVLLTTVAVQGWDGLSLEFLTNFSSRNPEAAGIKAALWGSVWVCGVCGLVALPIGVGTAIYLEEFAGKNRLTSFVRTNISNLAGVPSIVYGIIGLTIFARMFGLPGIGTETEPGLTVGSTWYDSYYTADGGVAFRPLESRGAPAGAIVDGTPLLLVDEVDTSVVQPRQLPALVVADGDRGFSVALEEAAIPITIGTAEEARDRGATLAGFVRVTESGNPRVWDRTTAYLTDATLSGAVLDQATSVEGRWLSCEDLAGETLFVRVPDDRYRIESGDRAHRLRTVLPRITRTQLEATSAPERIEVMLGEGGRLVQGELWNEYRVQGRRPTRYALVEAKAAPAADPPPVGGWLPVYPRLRNEFLETGSRTVRASVVADDAPIDGLPPGAILASDAGAPLPDQRLERRSWYYFQFPFGKGVFAGGLTLMLVILPVVIIASVEALRAVPNSLRQASLAMGATRWQTVQKVTLPASIPMIMTGSILAMSRAIGEAAPILVLGVALFITRTPQNLMDQFTILPMQIYNWAQRPGESFQELAAAGIIVLLVVLLTFNAAAILIRQRLQSRLES